MNVPYTRDQIKKLHKGINITKFLVRYDEKGEPVYYPNRRQRRSNNDIQSNNRKYINERKAITRNVLVQEIKNDMGNVIKTIKHLFNIKKR